MDISLKEAREKLARLWFFSSGGLFLIFIFYTAFSRFDSKDAEGWQWFTQNIVPSLTLITTAYFSTKNHDPALDIDGFTYKLALYLSLAYFIVLYLTILLAPLSFKFSGLSIIEFLKKSALYLNIFQGLITASLGLFFIKEKSKKP